MNKLLLITTFILFAGNLSYPGISTMPVSEIQPGMQGVGKTVFAGDKIEEFEFEVIEIIPNFRAKGDLILVKLVGDKVNYTNVVAGMSGSPMYISGKLIGALSYRMGIFLKDPIAGVTPIDQMLEIIDREKVREQELALNTGTNYDFIDMAVGAKKASLEKFIPPVLKNRLQPRDNASDFLPLEIPLVLSGFGGNSYQMSAQMFGNWGFKVFQGGGSGSTAAKSDNEPLQPGSAYAVVLVDGDIGLQATGTVTYVDGNNVVGMGHPFLNFGAVGLPMAKAKILTTISSMMASTKMSALTEIVGAVHQDRTTGVMGVHGEIAKMIPFHLKFKSEITEPLEYNFRIAEERSLYPLTPLIFSIVMANALESARLSVSSQTLQLDGKINLKGYDSIPLTNYYAGSTPSAFVTDAIEATGELAAIVGALLSNNFEQPEIESIDLNFNTLYKKYLAFIERLDVDKTSVKPGDEITVTIDLKEYQGQSHIIQHTLKIPEEINASRINIIAGSGGTITNLETRISPQKFRPRNFKQLLDIINNRRKNNYIFFQLRLPDKGIQVAGEELPGLPPSIMSVIQSQKSSGTIDTIPDRVLVEEKIQTDFSVDGAKSVWLKIEPK